MANTKSAKKAIRVALRKRAMNLKVSKDLKSKIKTFENTLADKKQGDEVAASFKKAQGVIDKSVKLKLLHRNTAARMKSALSKKYKDSK